jgi:hypothetical protein
VGRHLFPDVEGGYEEVDGVSAMGFRLDGFPVACHTMENSAELNAIVDDLAFVGMILVVLAVAAPVIKRMSST